MKAYVVSMTIEREYRIPEEAILYITDDISKAEDYCDNYNPPHGFFKSESPTRMYRKRERCGKDSILWLNITSNVPMELTGGKS